MSHLVFQLLKGAGAAVMALAPCADSDFEGHCAKPAIFVAEEADVLKKKDFFFLTNTTMCKA